MMAYLFVNADISMFMLSLLYGDLISYFRSFLFSASSEIQNGICPTCSSRSNEA